MSSLIANYVGSTERLTAGGINRAAGIIGCEVRALLAVIQVEASGRGFDRSGRPKMLFEPHIFHAVLLRRKSSSFNRARALGLAYPRWGMRPYPADSYPRLVQACALDPEAAVQAASWGLPQILGRNYEDAGYASATDMVQAFIASGEDEHLAAMARFIWANSTMRAALVRKDWAGFAYCYNGKGYKKNAYDTNLADAYARAPRVVLDTKAVPVPKPSPTTAPVQLPTPAPFTAAARNEAVAKTAATTAAVSSAGAQVATVGVAAATAVTIAQPHVGHWPLIFGGLAIAAAAGLAAHAYLSRKRSIAFTTAAAASAEPHDSQSIVHELAH